MVRSFTAIIEQDEDGVYVGRVPELRGCVTQGDSLDELLVNLKDAINLYLEVKKEELDSQLIKFVGTQQIEIEE